MAPRLLLLLALTACAAPERPRVALLPLGAVRPGAMEQLRKALAGDFEVRVAPGMPVPAAAWVPSRRQYDADALLDRLPAAAPGELLLAVCGLDAGTRALTYVFGLAEQGGRRAVIFLPRLAALAGPAVWEHRLEVTALHELGHLAGRGHCPNRTCLMHFSTTPADTDRKRARLCRACRAREVVG